MPCGLVRPESRVVTVAVPAASGRSSMTLPSLGVLTRRSPSGVQASIRASSTRAQTRAVQPEGTVSCLGVDSGPAPSPAGTTRVVLESADAARSAAETDGDADEGAGDDGPAAAAVDGVRGRRLAAAEVQAASAATAVAASKASGRRRTGSVTCSPPPPVRTGERTRKLARAAVRRSS